MKLLTTTIGPECQGEIPRLQNSLLEHDWSAELLVASDATIPGIQTLPIRSLGTPGQFGRDCKCNFANYFPEIADEEPVAWIDSDCVAIGPEPDWPTLPTSSVSGISGSGRPWVKGPGFHPSKYFADIVARMPDGMVLLWSTFLQFDSMATARKVCTVWREEFLRRNHAHTAEDEPALWAACMATEVKTIFSGGTFGEPVPNLKHLSVTKRRQPYLKDVYALPQ